MVSDEGSEQAGGVELPKAICRVALGKGGLNQNNSPAIEPTLFLAGRSENAVLIRGKGLERKNNLVDNAPALIYRGSRKSLVAAPRFREIYYLNPNPKLGATTLRFLADV